ncbi:hypothetical protein [Limnobacter thiooxidans]
MTSRSCWHEYFGSLSTGIGYDVIPLERITLVELHHLASAFDLNACR